MLLIYRTEYNDIIYCSLDEKTHTHSHRSKSDISNLFLESLNICVFMFLKGQFKLVWIWRVEKKRRHKSKSPLEFHEIRNLVGRSAEQRKQATTTRNCFRNKTSFSTVQKYFQFATNERTSHSFSIEKFQFAKLFRANAFVYQRATATTTNSQCIIHVILLSISENEIYYDKHN